MEIIRYAVVSKYDYEAFNVQALLWSVMMTGHDLLIAPLLLPKHLEWWIFKYDQAGTCIDRVAFDEADVDASEIPDCADIVNGPLQRREYNISLVQ